jgi:deoxyribodipyrimidine photo-lyase
MPKAILCLNYIHRIQDNPLFTFCANEKLDIIPIVFFTQKQIAKLGSAERLWLNHSLKDFDESLQGKLLIANSDEDIEQLINDQKPDFFLYSFNSETRIKHDYEELSRDFPELEFKRFAANNIFDFEKIKNKSGTPFKVFTPFYKHCLTKTKIHIVDQLKNQLSNSIEKYINIIEIQSPRKLSDLNLLGPKKNWNNAWQIKMIKGWDVSEKAARQILDEFSDASVMDYPNKRDLPADRGTSRLSSYLHFGMISPFRIWFELEQKKIEMKIKDDSNGYDVFLRQLCWREFAQYTLYHFPRSSHSNLNEKFNNFPWKKNAHALQAWQKGLTGYPIVDAGMRELWQTGWMHNRVRMIVGSFLVKDLMIHWLEGAKWFEDTLFDADLANNSMGWQWVAGSGVDASPYFRIFNPMTQSERFDKKAQYIRQWIPELKNLDDKWIHRPFEAPEMILEVAGVKLGKTYPQPLVNHDSVRKEALAAYKALKDPLKNVTSSIFQS